MKVNTQLLGEASVAPVIVTQEEAVRALATSSVVGLQLPERTSDSTIGQHLAPLIHGHILSTASLIGDQLTKVIRLLMTDIDVAISQDERKAAVDAMNETVKTWCEAAGVTMTAAEVMAHGKKITKRNNNAPNMTAGAAYFDNRTVILSNDKRPNGSHNPSD